MAEAALKLGLDPQSAVLDCGAGTGILGKMLAKGGMKVIDAIDASQGFLEALMKTGAYRSAKCCYMGNGDLPEPERRGLYDLVVASGCFLKDHIPSTAFPEICDYLKPGGYFVTAIRVIYWDEKETVYNYGNKLRELMAS